MKIVGPNGIQTETKQNECQLSTYYVLWKYENLWDIAQLNKRRDILKQNDSKVYNRFKAKYVRINQIVRYTILIKVM